MSREELLRRYEEGYDVLAAAIAGAGDKLDVRPDPNEWTPREIVHHCADSELTSAIRLRRLLAEDNPEIVGYDQEEFARRLWYDRPIEASLEAVRGARSSTAQILHRLSETDWARAGTHTESGPYSVETWLEIYAAHCHDHAEQIGRAILGGDS